MREVARRILDGWIARRIARRIGCFNARRIDQRMARRITRGNRIVDGLLANSHSISRCVQMICAEMPGSRMQSRRPRFELCGFAARLFARGANCGS